MANASGNQSKVELALNPMSGVDVLGDGAEPILTAGVVRSFTKAEAAALLAMTNSHGTPIVRKIKGASS